VEFKLDASSTQINMELHLKNNIEVPYDPSISLLGPYPKSTFNRNTCTSMFRAGLFTIAILGNHPTCQETKEWISEIWYLYTLLYFSAINNNEIILPSGKKCSI
jgi:hypothetical protein